MYQKRPTGVTIISIATIIYGVLDICQLFMPIITEERIEYSIPITGILLSLFGIGTLALKEWARIGMIFGCMLAIFQSLLGIYYERLPVAFILNILFIILFGAWSFFISHVQKLR